MKFYLPIAGAALAVGFATGVFINFWALTTLLP